MAAAQAARCDRAAAAGAIVRARHGRSIGTPFRMAYHAVCDNMLAVQDTMLRKARDGGATRLSGAVQDVRVIPHIH